MNTSATLIARGAIAESLNNNGAYVTISETHGVIDALQARADDWAEQTHGIGISGREESADGSIIEYWNVFVTYQPKVQIGLTHDEMLTILDALSVLENGICADYAKAGPAQADVCKRELNMIREIADKILDARA